MRIAPNLRNLIFRALCRGRGVEREIGGIKFRLDESLRRWNFEKETHAFEKIRPMIYAGDVALDIGANFGLYSLPISRWIGEDGRLYAFEPLVGNISLLTRNITLNKIANAIVVASAVSNDSAEKLRFFCNNQDVSLTASLNVPDSAEFIEVDNVRIDDWSKRQNVIPNFIKIDVEGAEMEVLRGAEFTLRTYKPKLLIEVHGFALPNFGTRVEELRSWLSELGYRETLIEGGGDYFTSIFEFFEV
jgi:FkbM family methyltransferase